MEKPGKKAYDNEGGSFSLISLYLKGSLRRESLGEDDAIKKLLESMEGGTVSEEEKWADLLRKCLTWKSVRDLSGILVRPLTAVELLFLYESIEEFVRLTRGKVTAIVEKESKPGD